MAPVVDELGHDLLSVSIEIQIFSSFHSSCIFIEENFAGKLLHYVKDADTVYLFYNI